MLEIRKFCYKGKYFKLYKVGGGDAVDVQQCLSDIDYGTFASISVQDGISSVVFNSYGYTLLEGYSRHRGTANKLYFARSIPAGVPCSEVPEVKEIVRHHALQKSLLNAGVKPISVTGKLVLLFRGEIAPGNFNLSTNQFLKQCWIVPPEQRFAFMAKSN